MVKRIMMIIHSTVTVTLCEQFIFFFFSFFYIASSIINMKSLLQLVIKIIKIKVSSANNVWVTIFLNLGNFCKSHVDGDDNIYICDLKIRSPTLTDYHHHTPQPIAPMPDSWMLLLLSTYNIYYKIYTSTTTSTSTLNLITTETESGFGIPKKNSLKKLWTSRPPQA